MKTGSPALSTPGQPMNCERMDRFLHFLGDGSLPLNIFRRWLYFEARRSRGEVTLPTWDRWFFPVFKTFQRGGFGHGENVRSVRQSTSSGQFS